MKKYLYIAIGALACILLPAQNAAASFITFESLPTSNSNHVSRHGIGGPVLADDFTATASGFVVGIEWWGAAPLSSGDDLWEISFHDDAGGTGTPSTIFPTGILSQHLLNATGTDADNDGIFHFVASWTPADLFILANTTYWFSVANATGDGWTWANGAAATIGTEAFNGVVSTGTGPNGGPHFGPWSALDTSFAFRIILAPEPGSVALVALGLLTIVSIIRRHYDNA